MTGKIEKTVVVTGGSRGIGRAICLAFAKPGTHLFFNYHSEKSSAAETGKMVEKAGGKATFLKVNVAKEKEVAQFLKKVVDTTGRLDVLVNNAGITSDGLLVRMKEEQWNKIIDVNLKGTFNCMKFAAKPMMKQRYGRIINPSSNVGVSGNPGQANYVASKAGIIGLTKAAAKELASRNITVNAVAPGYVATDMTRNLTDKAKEAMLSRIPLKRAAQPEDVAATVIFLASKGADYITGQVIHVSGGMYM